MRIMVAIAALMLAGCVPIIKPAIYDSRQHERMTPAQEAAAWCATGFQAPGMDGFCDDRHY